MKRTGKAGLQDTSRWLSWVGAAAMATAMGTGCGAGPDSFGEIAETSDEITDVTQSVVKRQSIGNCWLYATASWVESMNKAATAAELNASESYWSYWHWFEQITNGEVDNDELSTGGGYDVSKYLILRYGVIAEEDFIPEEATAEMSYRQKSALDAINAALSTGALKDPADRKSKAKVRAALDQAWGLSDTVKDHMTSVFGAYYSRNLTTKSASTGKETASTAGTPILRAREVQVQYTAGPAKPAQTKTLADALGAWQEAWYPSTDSGRRSFQKRFQRALHDAQPVILSWFVDFNALDGQGRFFEPPATPGRQGGHMVVMEDYEIDNVPGFGTLPAGTLETRPAALQAALDDQASIKFIRVKNSWGSYRADRAFALPGYHDLYMKYLNGPLKHCEEKNGTADPTQCYDSDGITDIVLPPGY